MTCSWREYNDNSGYVQGTWQFLLWNQNKTWLTCSPLTPGGLLELPVVVVDCDVLTTLYGYRWGL